MPAAPAEPPAAIAVCPNSWSVNAFSVPPARARDRSSNCPRDGRNNILAQRIVETVIGRLITDEQFRAAFLAAPVGTLTGLTERGMDLTPLEIAALVATDPALWERAAESLDARLQKASLVNSSLHKASTNHV